MLHIVILGWLFVIIMMAATSGGWLMGMLITLFFGILPLMLIIWIMTYKARRNKQKRDSHS